MARKKSKKIKHIQIDVYEDEDGIVTHLIVPVDIFFVPDLIEEITKYMRNSLAMEAH